MNPRIHIPTLCLLAVIAVSACAPAPAASPAAPPAPPPAGEQPAITEAAASVATEAPTAIPQAAATSRGPDLEATDPTSVNLASGGLQLVEFFRFT
jgi:hypothetical protein